jgi:sugar/nucleoside kinase (ribokinase family)
MDENKDENGKDQNKIPKILTIGKATEDVYLRSDEFDPHIEGKVAFTHLPLGAKLDVEDVHFMTGGNATNVAVTFARQGLNASYMWILGNDYASQIVLQDLKKEGVDTSLVVQDEKYRAGFSVVLLANSGERTVLNYHGSVIRSHASSGLDLKLDEIKNFDWVYPTSISNFDVFEEIVTRSAESGVKVMLNPAGSELREPDKLKSLLEDVEVLCLNKEEMMSLVEGETLEELVRHGLHYCPVVIVSDGPNGVCASDGVNLVTAGMYEDVPVVDRLGAGDAFASGFLSQWILGKTLEESIVFASANSTSVVNLIGAKPGILRKGAKLHDMSLKITKI